MDTCALITTHDALSLSLFTFSQHRDVQRYANWSESKRKRKMRRGGLYRGGGVIYLLDPDLATCCYYIAYEHCCLFCSLFLPFSLCPHVPISLSVLSLACLLGSRCVFQTITHHPPHLPLLPPKKHRIKLLAAPHTMPVLCGCGWIWFHPTADAYLCKSKHFICQLSQWYTLILYST